MKTTRSTQSNIQNKIEDFQQKLPVEIRELFSFCTQKGFILTIVGGAVRDFLLSDKIVFDLDIELQFEKELSDELWKLERNKLFNEISKNCSIEKLSYGVIRVKVREYELEFAPARIEEFQKGALDHKNFIASFKSSIDYKESFSRRDFTINALGIEFSKKSVKFIDPFNGLKDLQNEVLTNCSDDFFMDPVRFARLIRFKNKLDFNVDLKLIDRLSEFNLEALSTHYFFEEGLKVDLLNFLSDFKIFFKKSNLKISAHFKLLFDQCFFKQKVKLSAQSDFLYYISLVEDLADETLLEIVKGIGLSQKRVKRLIRFKNDYREFLQINLKNLKNDLLSSSEEEGIRNKELSKVAKIFEEFEIITEVITFDLPNYDELYRLKSDLETSFKNELVNKRYLRGIYYLLLKA